MSFTPNEEVGRRERVWIALTELFTARELQDYDYRSIASCLRASGYSMEELEEILRHEVEPVFGANLSPLNTAPEFEGWSKDYIREEIQARLRKGDRLLDKAADLFGLGSQKRLIVADRWRAVVQAM